MQGLQGKKVIAIATGSLHCVCCTEEGRWRCSASQERPSLCCGPHEHVTVHAAQEELALDRPACRLGPRLPRNRVLGAPTHTPPQGPCLQKKQCIRDKAWGRMV